MKTTKELIIADITAKVEAKLASQKVELSLFEDYYKAIAALIEQADRGNSIKNDAKPIVKSAMDKLGMAKSAFERAVRYSIDIEKKVKELGIPLDSKYGANKDRMFTEEKNIEEGIARLSKIQKDLNF